MPLRGQGRRIIVLSEGDTEELAVRYFITRQWRLDGLGSVGLRSINLYGKPQKAGKYAGRYLDDQEVLAVFTLVDLHGTTQVVHTAFDDLEAKVRRVREWLHAQVNHTRAQRFFPHVSVHQTEAWILAEGRALAALLNDPAIRPDASAELKNFQDPPSSRLNELFLRAKSRRYNKISDGRPLLAGMQFEPVYDSCRHFRAFYDDLRYAANP
jgi:uncharacterized protein DUF4276